MEQYMTLSVRRIAITASKEDVQDFFARKIPNGDPVVKSLVNDANRVFKSATVTFKGRTKAECKATIEKLKDPNCRTLVDGTGISSNLDFDGDFLGLTELANRCAIDEKPHFDVYFVHGLGGHAYNSFRHKAKYHRASNMWARDTLPDSLDRPGKKGRYLTFGYPAPVIDSDEISQSIEDTAVELLRKILDDRGKHCDRPLFFVCHSLGGLVVCQAVLLALVRNKNDAYRSDFQKAFFIQGQTLIKGIIFFGTPFKGSRSANLGVKMATNLKLPLNKTHIMYLRVEDQDVAKFVDEFDKLTEQIGLPLLIFFELKKTKIFFFRERVVGRDSARGHFGKRVPKIGLLADHHKLVKFGYPDSLYEKDVERRIKDLVHNALDAYQPGNNFAAFREAGMETLSLLIPRDARRRSMHSTSVSLDPPAAALTPTPSAFSPKQSDNPAGGPLPDSARSELDGSSRSAANAWVEDTVRILKFNQDERRINDVDDGSAETCDWILSKTEFQKWNAPLSDSVMFIQGGPGLGKSVLAKFLVQRLRCGDGDGNKNREPLNPAVGQNREPIVAHFFPRGTEFCDVDNSPKAILLSVLYQIWEADSEPCNRAIRNLFNRFNQSRNLDFYWTLFNDVRSIVTRDLYCIVDGLDECIKEFKSPRQSSVDDRMEGFLRRLCDIARGPSIQEKTPCTKILITTRPTVEVDNAAIGRDIVLEIQESDTKAAVGKFVEDGVRHLSQLKQLSSPAQDFIKEEITQKSGHVFQTAQTALRRLRSERYDLEIREVISRALARVNSQKSDDAYEETLEILESAPLQDRVKAARIIRILFFLQNKLSLLELEHALLVDMHGSEPILKPAPVQSTLGVFIRTYLALLVKIDNDSMVSLQHQTVREYFQSLSGDRWQIHSCAERKGGHLQLALICIGHMVLWRGHAVTQEDIDVHKGNEILARMDKVTFLRYASYYWDLHTKEAGDLIIPHMPLVDKLLGIHSNQSYNDYYLPMLDLRRSQGLDTLDKHRDFFPLLPGSFLATNDLLHVLRGHTCQRKVQKRELTRRVMFWSSQALNSDAIEADFDLNEQDKNGSGLTPLHCACRNGHLETAKLLLACGASGEVYDADRNSPFSMAVEGNWEEMAEMLITRNQCWDDPERGGKSVTLHMACFFGMSKVVQHLLGIGYDVNAQDLDGWAPIHCATEKNQMDTLEVLLKAGGLPDSRTNFGNTPLHLAAREGYLAVIQMLFRYKADMDPIPIESDGGSPHHAAAAGGHLEVFKYLDAKCKDVRPDEDGDLPIHLAAYGGYLPIVNHLSDISNITAMDQNKRLPIHAAAAGGQLETVQRLLQLGREVGLSVDVKCRDLSATVEESPDGLLTPLYLAVALGHQKIAEYLINEGADPNVRSFRNRTLLHEAARQNTSEIFELLLKYHLDPFEANETLETPLHMAAALGNSDIVDIYLGMQDIRAGLDMVDADGDSALALAMQNSHAQISGKLVSKGANVHLLDRDQSSTLMLSLYLEEVTVFEKLLEEGVDVNIANAFGLTALHKAASYGMLDACETLIERGANINAERPVTKVTPLHCAGKSNSVDIVLRLLNAGADPFKRELSGASIMDYVTTCEPMSDLLRRYRKDYRPSNEGQTDALRQVFYATLRALPLTAPTDQAGRFKFRDLYGTLLYVTWYLKEYDTFRVWYEHWIFRSANSTPIWRYRCDNCRRENVEGSPWLCKQCPGTQVCSGCYEKRSEGLYARGCSVDHEHLEIAGEEWRKLEEGKVNAKGQTLWEWIAELKETHLTGDDDEHEDSTQHRKKVPVIQVSGVV